MSFYVNKVSGAATRFGVPNRLQPKYFIHEIYVGDEWLIVVEFIHDGKHYRAVVSLPIEKWISINIQEEKI